MFNRTVALRQRMSYIGGDRQTRETKNVRQGNGKARRMSRTIKLSYEISMALTSALPRCGECYFWMKSRDCPRERNINGMSRGPSCDDSTCDKFKAKDADTEARIAERWKPAAEYLKSL